MRIHRNGTPISSQDDWLEHAPPKSGEDHWVDGGSAKELARAWFPIPGEPVIPPELASLLATHPNLPDIRLIEAEPEARIPFDAYPGEPRNADLAIRAEGSVGTIAITVEAKADESFGDKIEPMLVAGARKLSRDTNTNIVERVKGLGGALLPPWEEGLDHFGELRYQLLTGVAGTLAYARALSAPVAVFVIHEFIDLDKTKESRRRNNRESLDRFVRRLSGGTIERLTRGVLSDPIRVPGSEMIPGDVDLYLGKVRRDL